MSSSFDSLNLHVNVIPCPPPFSRSLTMKDWYWIRLVFWNYDYKMSNLDILHLDLCYLSRFIFISPQITSQAGTVAAQLRVEAEVCGEARRPCSEKWILKWICHIFSRHVHPKLLDPCIFWLIQKWQQDALLYPIISLPDRLGVEMWKW